MCKTWGGGSDSFFEYLVKYPRLTRTSDPTFINAWREAVDSSLKVLAPLILGIAGLATLLIYEALIPRHPIVRALYALFTDFSLAQ